MNVFEFLGLSHDHRKSGKVVQLVKNFEEVPASKIKFPLIGQIKKDGVFGVLVINESGESGVFGRTGKRLCSTGHLEDQYDWLPAGVYITEVCLPGHSLEVLSGIVNPNRKEELRPELSEDWLNKGRMYFHDHLSIEDFIAGKDSRSYIERLSHLKFLNVPYLLDCPLNSDSDIELYASSVIESGEEGVVLKQDVSWEAGHKGWRSMKRVRRVSYDLLCVGVEEGTGKYTNKVANLIFQWKGGKTLKAMLGKGWSHHDAEVMWQSKEHRYNYYNPIGQIFEVYGLQDSSKGMIRLPKVGERRHDKEEPDV